MNIVGYKRVLRLAWSIPGRTILGVLCGAGLGWLAIRGAEWATLVEQFKDFPVFFAFLALLVFLLITLLRAYRWQVLFVAERPSLFRLFLVQNTGIGINNLTPVRVLSEAVQFAMLTLKHRVRPSVALATLGMERVLDMIASAVLLVVGLALIPTGGHFLPYAIAMAVMALISVLLVKALAASVRSRLLRRVRGLSSFAISIARLERSRGTLAYSLMVTLIYWLGIGVTGWVLAYVMGLGISPLVATLAILVALYVTTTLPGLPAAVGTFEFAVVYFLGLFGVQRELALSFALTVHAILFLPPVVIAMIVVSTSGLRPTAHKAGQVPDVSSGVFQPGPGKSPSHGD